MPQDVLLPSAVLRTALRLSPGCRLYYDPPSRGDSRDADEFFSTYRGRYATFVGFPERLVGPLDRAGRLPGRYTDPSGLTVQFERDDQVHEGLNPRHFIVTETAGAAALFADTLPRIARLGDLPHPVRFYRGDIVTVRPGVLGPDGPPPGERKVGSVLVEKPFTKDGIPRYDVLETGEEYAERLGKLKTAHRYPSEMHPRSWTCDGDDLELVKRGNAWALYNDPSKLSFDTEFEESQFWAMDGVSRSVELPRPQPRVASFIGVPLAEAYEVFLAKEADVLLLSDPKHRGGEERYLPRKLHPCFSQYQERVHKLTERLWAKEALSSAA